jgi:hypothetical protein
VSEDDLFSKVYKEVRDPTGSIKEGFRVFFASYQQKFGSEKDDFLHPDFRLEENDPVFELHDRVQYFTRYLDSRLSVAFHATSSLLYKKYQIQMSINERHAELTKKQQELYSASQVKSDNAFSDFYLKTEERMLTRVEAEDKFLALEHRIKQVLQISQAIVKNESQIYHIGPRTADPGSKLRSQKSLVAKSAAAKVTSKSVVIPASAPVAENATAGASSSLKIVRPDYSKHAVKAIGQRPPLFKAPPPQLVAQEPPKLNTARPLNSSFKVDINAKSQAKGVLHNSFKAGKACTESASQQKDGTAASGEATRSKQS